MNPRERMMLGVFFGLLLVGGSGAGFYFGFFQDYVETLRQTAADEAKLKEKTDELARLQKEEDDILTLSPRLQDYKKISLPDLPLKPGVKTRNPQDVAEHQKHWQGMYGVYLTDMLQRNGFVSSSINVQAKTPDTKTPDAKGGAPAKDKIPVYTRLPFTVQGNATLKSIIAMLKEFHSDPLLQEVRSLSITKPQTPRAGAPAQALDVVMTVEVLIVTGAESRPYDQAHLMPTEIKKGAEHVLANPASGPRVYEELLAKDPFWGKKVGGGGGGGVEKPSGPHEDPKVVLPFVHLTSIYTDDGRWKATFYNQGTGEDERPVSDRRFRNDIFVTDIYGERSFTGSCVYLDAKQLVVEDQEGRRFLIHIGDSLEKVLDPKKKLSDKELTQFNLSPKKAEATAEKKVEATAEKEPD